MRDIAMIPDFNTWWASLPVEMPTLAGGPRYVGAREAWEYLLPIVLAERAESDQLRAALREHGAESARMQAELMELRRRYRVGLSKPVDSV